MEHVLLKDISISSRHCYVTARAIRFTDFMSSVQKDTRIRLELILLDAEGNMLEARVPEYWHKRSNIKLEENEIYVIKNFVVIGGKTSFRAVDRDCMIQFTQTTTIKQPSSFPTNFPLYGYLPVTFDVMRTRIGSVTLTSDTVVFLLACSHARDQNTQKLGTKRLRNLRVSNGVETVDVALWGKHADLFDAEGCMSAAIEKPVVLLLCGVMCKMFNDNLCLQNSAGCSWYINPDIDEARLLRSTYAAHLPPLAWLDAPQRAPQIENYSVAELTSLTDSAPLQNKRFALEAKIKEVDPENPWWYVACNKCYKGARDCGGVFRCNDYSCSSTETGPRYRLTTRVIDTTALLEDIDAPSVQLVFFGPIAEELLGVPVHDLINLAQQTGHALPERIKNVYGRIVNVRVGVNRFSFETPELSLQVKSIVSVRSSAPQQTIQVVSQVAVDDPAQIVASGSGAPKDVLRSPVVESTKPGAQDEVPGQQQQQVVESATDAPTSETPLITSKIIDGDQQSQTHQGTKEMTPSATGMKRQRTAKEDAGGVPHKRSESQAKRRLILDEKTPDKN